MTQEWTRRFLAAPERVEESLELYRSMGLEARAEKPTATDFTDQCGGCVESGCSNYLVIYTRPIEKKK